MKDLSQRVKEQEYNNEPVHYCKTCLSLKVKTIEFKPTEAGESRDVDYCGSCSNTSIGQAHITEWEDMYEEKHGKRYIDKK